MSMSRLLRTQAAAAAGADAAESGGCPGHAPSTSTTGGIRAHTPALSHPLITYTRACWVGWMVVMGESGDGSACFITLLS